MTMAEEATVRVCGRYRLTRSVYVRRHGFSEFYVGEAYTIRGGKRLAQKELRRDRDARVFRYQEQEIARQALADQEQERCSCGGSGWEMEPGQEFPDPCPRCADQEQER